MLHLIPGTFDSPKREFIHNAISDAIDKGRKTVLIVPEQAAYEREKEYLLSAGAVKANKLTVTGFSRMIRTLLSDTDLRIKPRADESARNVLMSIACENARDRLTMYGGFGSRPRLAAELLAEYDEIKKAGLTVADMENTAMTLDGTLKTKMRELSVIFAAYEAILSSRFSDATDNIPMTTEFLKSNRFFEGYSIFIDDFRGFTAVQIKLIEQLLLQAEEVWISVKCDSVFSDRDNPENDAFGHTMKFVEGIKGFAKRNNIDIFIPEENLTDEDEVSTTLHRGFYAVTPENYVYKGETDRITIGSAADKFEECTLVALEIRNLVEKEGIRCNRIAICERGSGYAAPMAAALRRYGLPVFEDRSAALSDFPVVRMLSSALKIAAGGFVTEEVLTYLKSGMSPLETEALAALQRYVYIWQIEGKKWESDFTSPPSGFDSKPDDKTDALLAAVNESRKETVEPIIRLRTKLRENDSLKSCTALYEFLEETEARDRFCEYADKLNAAGDEQGANLCGGVWDKLMDILDALYGAIENQSVTPVRLSELFEIMISTGTVEKIPAGIDEIVIGTADRMRFSSPEAVFLVGAENGIFPAEITNGGMFTVREKKSLEQNGFVLEAQPENKFDEERLITYCAVTAAPRLCVTYSVRNLSGDEYQPSEIVKQLEFLFPSCRKIAYNDIAPADRIGSPETAFTEYTSHCATDDTLTATLREYCLSDDNLAPFIPAIDKALGKAPIKIESADTATEFFGNEMRISASKAEQFYKCAFSYFCRYGLNLDEPSVAAMDNRIRGNMIHEVLEKLLREHPKDDFTAMDREALFAEIKRLSETFISEYLSGRDDKTATVNRQFDNVESILYEIVPRLQKEFRDSGFTYTDMELDISDSVNAGARPYEIPLSDGGLIRIIGKVDRVDTYNNGEDTFVRIVDYKSGAKEFHSADVLNGLNLQMPMYLFCILRGGKAPYNTAKPAGFLYLPAKADDFSSSNALGRNSTEEEEAESRRSGGRLFGCVLENTDVINAMNTDFIRLKQKKDGTYTGNTLSPKEFRGLEKELSDLMKNMGDCLHTGGIDALPAKHGGRLPCEYCNFKDICQRESEGREKELIEMKHEDVRAYLTEKEENGDGIHG